MSRPRCDARLPAPHGARICSALATHFGPRDDGEEYYVCPFHAWMLRVFGERPTRIKPRSA